MRVGLQRIVLCYTAIYFGDALSDGMLHCVVLTLCGALTLTVEGYFTCFPSWELTIQLLHTCHACLCACQHTGGPAGRRECAYVECMECVKYCGVSVTCEE